MYCAGPHEGNRCSNLNNLKCLNCVYVNEKFNLKRDTNHCAMDSDKCKTLKAKITRCINTTDYPIRPIVPALLGKAAKKTEAARTPATRAATVARGRVGGEKGNVPLNKGNG